MVKDRFLSLSIFFLFCFFTLDRSIASNKYAMPDLAQEQGYTCFCHAAANLLYWFGENGYPKLIPQGANENDRKELLVKRIIISCNYTYAKMDDNLKMDPQGGLEKYIRSCGYESKIRYFFINAEESDFLNHPLFKDNDRNDVGFLLTRTLYTDDGQRLTPTNRPNHALTLVNCSNDVITVRDPAHMKNEWGRRALALTVSKSVDEQNHHLLLMQGYPSDYFSYEKGAIPALTGAFYIRIYSQ